jgi:hypothetical protein
VRKTCLIALAVALFAVPGAALASPANNPDFNFSRTFQFDPGKTKCPDAQWVNGQGEADSTGNTSFGLVLTKNCATPVNASAGAVANSIAGSAPTELGFDLKDGDPCGAGAPRFNLLTQQGSFHFVGGCANGLEDSTMLGNGWTRYRFQLQDPTDAFPIVPPGSTVDLLEIIADEQGTYHIDNIRVNDRCAEKPGQSRACSTP